MFVAVVLSLNFEPLPCVNFMLPLARYHAVTATNYITVPDLNAHNFRSCHTKPVSNTELADRMLRDYIRSRKRDSNPPKQQFCGPSMLKLDLSCAGIYVRAKHKDADKTLKFGKLPERINQP